MLNFDLVSILFSTSIPTSFNILVKMFFTLVSLVFTVCSNTYKPTGFRAEFLLPLHTYEDSQQDSYILSCTNIAYLVQLWVQLPATGSRSKKRTQRSNAGSQTARRTTTTTKLLTSRLRHVSKQKMASKLTLLSLQTWSLTGFGRRYEDFVHQGSCTLQYK